MSKKSQEQIIDDFILVHGDKYDYSLVEYLGCKTKVKITCPEHGVFHITPSSHKNGVGCKECGFEKKRKSRKLSAEDAISNIKEAIGNFYDLSEAEYIDSQTKIKVICPDHGEFWTLPGNIRNGRKCRQCNSDEMSKALRKETSTVIEDFKQVHGDKYLYDFEEIDKVFKNTGSLLPVQCKHHGTFYVSYDTHYGEQSNCPKCCRRSTGILSRFDNDLSCYIYNLTFTEKETGYQFEKVGITTKKKILRRFNSHTKEAFDIKINYYYETTLGKSVEIEDMFLTELDENNLRYRVHTLKEKYPNTDNGWTECYPYGSISFKDWIDEKVINT